MTGRYGLFAAVTVAALAGPGCVCCGNQGHRVACEAGPDCDVPVGQRNQVYVFAVGGLNPAGVVALDALRNELHRQGFAKVATGQTVHVGWFAREMRRVRADDPNAVFVLVGGPGGGVAAARLAERAVADGLPVGGLVLVGADVPAVAGGVRVLAVGGPAPVWGGVEVVEVPGVSGTAVAADPRCAAAVAGLLNEVALNTAARPAPAPAVWDYPHATVGRPEVEPGADPDWAFLFDRPGGAPRAIEDPDPARR